MELRRKRVSGKRRELVQQLSQREAFRLAIAAELHPRQDDLAVAALHQLQRLCHNFLGGVLRLRPRTNGTMQKVHDLPQPSWTRSKGVVRACEIGGCLYGPEPMAQQLHKPVLVLIGMGMRASSDPPLVGHRGAGGDDAGVRVGPDGAADYLPRTLSAICVTVQVLMMNRSDGVFESGPLPAWLRGAGAASALRRTGDLAFEGVNGELHKRLL